MNPAVPDISVAGLALAAIPPAIVVLILYRWACGPGSATYALVRMAVQLILIGYALTFLFGSGSPALIVLVLAVMLSMAAWIALRPLQTRQPRTYGRVLISIAAGGLLTLALVTQLILTSDTRLDPRFVIPLAGMIFASCMNTVSLAAERLAAESGGGADYQSARRAALRAALIPLINSLLAVGLVSLPGMMTGQILSGVSPLVATRYQVVVMCMLFGASGIAAACYLFLARPADR